MARSGVSRVSRAFGGEYGVIDLIAPGVHGTDDEPVHVPQVLGHGLQRGHTR